jgi:23S rRNA (cytidine1920-2'-O)/16S rRNA (cytidine1409-2'-O)-methyltransferase
VQRKRLLVVLESLRPDLDNPEASIKSGGVRVDGVIVTNPSSMVLPSSSVTVSLGGPLKGERKLGAGLDILGVETLEGLTALDVGASTGGFTKEMLTRGATRVYAVDVGHGQLLGSLRQDERVVNLEATNAADLTPQLVPDAIDFVTIDVSYTPLRSIVPDLARGVRFSAQPRLVALVKPMFELQAGALPTSADDLAAAVATATGSSV